MKSKLFTVQCHGLILPFRNKINHIMDINVIITMEYNSLLSLEEAILNRFSCVCHIMDSNFYVHQKMILKTISKS